MALESVNPATGELIARYDAMPDQETGNIIRAAHEAAREWAAAGFAARAACLRAAAAALRDRKNEWARLMATEMGKPISAGIAEAEKCAWGCEYYADHAEGLLADEVVLTEASRSLVRYQPLGAILAVMPWNFPFWQVFRAAAPALMAGNAMALKHSSNVTGCALAIERIFHEAGVPTAAFRTLRLESARVRPVIENPLVAGVTLTGSEAAGREVGGTAGRCLKPSVLELGGSDPFIVLADADIEPTARSAAAARTINSGQSCIAAKRFIVVEQVYSAFLSAFTEAMRAITVGDPLDPETQVGPQARRELRDDLHSQVTRSIAQGARLVLGGTIPQGPGAWYPVSILEDVRPGMSAHDEEVFGPVAAVIRAADPMEAVHIANQNVYGLGASVWTRDAAAAEPVINQLEAGMVFVNEIVKSDPRLPFGGVKNSGYGRELAALGIREFVNAKTIWIR
ncbi:MAG TPA: NAD-dependent succinate-semialdehyde dehydrogenase [Bryobacteraceae bacterium]|nr:NAD-dependent succinate-semialdehyde dehydrogenase [Bryobacteraceae bacterium]